ncbi:TonB-dependent receptor [Sphingobium sp. V4]|uniref:TonB-dependent receptor n=1 Tax=Sphingobium sp. V4 TaxID=3038927 RepID=UPI002557ED0F|nr:TonB-dependent receptor [Sphingobium sp. V4]WIW89465.1 TonB-dependent receptor [Sphingobium sp. V4]
MKNIVQRTLFCGASALGLIAFSQPAMAQSADQGGSATDASAGDIIVTARRASESYINVPVQVAVQSGEALARTNANDLSKIAENIPFVQITKTSSGSGGGFVIRGVGSFAIDVGVSQAVLVNMDNVFIGRPRIISAAQYDIAQVEVLKGPQALFYGKNTPGGVISITTKDPEDHLEGYVRASYEFNARERILEGGISVPLSDTVGVRFAGRIGAADGWLKNDATGYAVNPLTPVAPFLAAFPVPAGVSRRAPRTDDTSGRITVKWQPNSDFTAKLKYTYGLSHSDGDNATNEAFCDPSRTTHATAFGIPDVQNDCRANGRVNHSGFPVGLTVNYPLANGGVPYGTTKSHLAGLELDYNFGGLSLSSITGYYNLKYRGAQNSYHDGLGNNLAAQSENATGFSQELRLSSQFEFPVNFVIGGYYGDQKQLNHSYSYILNLGLDPVRGSYFTYDRLTDQKTTTWSAFGQLRYDVTDQLELSAGVRYTSEKKSDYNGNAYIHPLAASFLEPAFFDRSTTFTDWSPEATLRWKPADGQMIYLSYKQGYKSGGFSAPPVFSRGYTDASTRFDPEKARGFEVGYKGELFDRRLRVELVGYRYNYSSQQVSIFVPDSLGFLIRNAGETRVQGIEGLLNWRVSNGLSLNASLGYNDAHYIKYEGAGCWAGQTVAQGCVPTGVGTATAQDLSGHQAPRAPKWAGTIGINYEGAVGDGLKVKLYGGGIYSSSYNASDNLDPFETQNQWFKVNASIGIASEDDKYELSLIGRNLTNQYTLTFSQDKARGLPGEYIGYFGRTREIALQGTVRF